MDKVFSGCIVMTEADAEEMQNLDEKCGWGFSAMDCMRFLADHMDANAIRKFSVEPNEVMEAIRTEEKIEFRLEDCNFHTFCGMLHDGKYDDAYKWIREDFEDTFEG